MAQPDWIRLDVVLAIHQRQLSEHGGDPGIRDVALLESALARPRNTLAYAGDEAGLPRLAAAYAFGIARNHPFVDGKKRVAWVVCRSFLSLNGWGLKATRRDAYEAVMRLAEGDLSEADLAAWIRQREAPK